MKSKISLKQIICFLLAVLMLMSTVGCKDNTTKKKKKKIIKKKVIVVTNDDEDNNNQNNDFVIDTDDSNDVEETEKGLGERPLPEVAEVKEKYVEPVVPEFEYDYATLNITEDYVIVYSFEKWNNRKESRNEDGSDRYINYTAYNRIAANDLKDWFKDNYNLNLKVMKDDAVSEDAKKILIGDTAYYTSNLKETEFAVKVRGNDLVFEGGHFTMVNKAVKWFETVEVKKGKVAVLNGSQDDFKSQVTLNGITYDYVWGTEFDGSEFNDDEYWHQASFGLERQDDMVNIFGDSRFQYIENGRLRLTGDRYYDESDGSIGYATSGEVNTKGIMMFRNGYFEFRARLPYTRGGFPAIWTMSNEDEKRVPNFYYDDGYGEYQKRFWTIEFDLFESFADSDHMTTTIHKWYSNGVGKTTISQTAIELTDAQIKKLNENAVKYKYSNQVTELNQSTYFAAETDEALEALKSKYAVKSGSSYYVDPELSLGANDVLAEDGETVIGKTYTYNPVYLNFDDGTKLDIFDYRLRPYTNLSKSMCTYAYNFTYSGENRYGNNKNGTYNWQWYFNPDTINQEYHIYSFHYTSTHCTVFMDGEAFLDFDWDPAYDYYDVNGDGYVEDISKNNNGVGFNLWHYFLIDCMIYTPNNFKIDEYRKLQAGDTPIDLYVDWVRCYQDLDDPSQALWFPNAEAD